MANAIINFITYTSASHARTIFDPVGAPVYDRYAAFARSRFFGIARNGRTSQFLSVVCSKKICRRIYSKLTSSHDTLTVGQYGNVRSYARSFIDRNFMGRRRSGLILGGIRGGVMKGKGYGSVYSIKISSANTAGRVNGSVNASRFRIPRGSATCDLRV